jgi:hypothetical protein
VIHIVGGFLLFTSPFASTTRLPPQPLHTIFCHHSHPIGNRLKAIDFIGGFELYGSKKRLIP